MSKGQALKLYKALIRESKKIPDYNFRNYALRRVRDSFRDNQLLKDENLISNKLEQGAKDLEIIKKQVVIGRLYAVDKLVIEHLACKK